MSRFTPQFVTAAEVSRNFGMWQDRASHAPLIVTHHGRPRITMLAMEDYEALRHDQGDERPSGADAMRLTALAEHLGGSFVAFDGQLRITALNTEAAIHIGEPAEELVGRSLDDLHPTIRDDPLREMVVRAAQGGEEAVIDIRSRLRPERLLRMRFFPYPDGAAVIFRNVAHEVRIEHDASERAALGAARIAHGGVVMTRLSVRGTFEQPEPVLAELVGFPAARLVGARLTDLLILRERAAIAEAVESVLARGETARFDVSLLRNGGGEIVATVALAPIREGFATTGAMMLLAGQPAASP